MAEKEQSDLPPCYSNLGFDADSSAGPSAPRNPEDEAGFRKDFTEDPSCPPYPQPEDFGPPPLFHKVPSLMFEDIYEACVRHAKKHCCYGTRFVNQMKLIDILNKGVFYYTLESFGEKRESKSEEKPYKGGSVDGPENGPPPDAWSMTALPPEMFRKCKVKMQIPHTESVRTCWKCDGSGQTTCSSCSGNGYERCWSCSGSGRGSEDDRCSSCSGSGTKSCIWCYGTGYNTCSRCDGYGKLLEFRVLIVKWGNHLSEFISDAGNMPAKLIRKAKGDEILRQVDNALLPVTNAPDSFVNAASARLLEKHRTAFPNELVIRQRQILRAIPYTRVAYQWKERDGEFYVYGNDRAVYFEDYPQPCCCCTCC